MHLDPRAHIGRLRWIRQYPVYREAPTTFAARTMAFTWREQLSTQDTMEFSACGGRRFRTPRNNISSFIAAVFDQRDLNIVRFWRKTLRPGSTFFDVGANIGLYAVPASLQVGSVGRTVCFEAHPALCRFLRDNVARNCADNVTVENVAVGSASGEARIAFDHSNPGETRVALETEYGDRVPMVSLDDYCRTHRIAAIDYMKIDVEGYEANVLKGAASIVERSPDLLIQTEYEPLHMGRYGERTEMAALLLSWGFLPYRIDWIDGIPEALHSLDGYSGELVWSRKSLHP